MKSFTASYGGMPREEKPHHCDGQNVLARSLPPNRYDYHPGLVRLPKRTWPPFQIEFVDSRVQTAKRPEFTATHTVTGQNIEVEAKSRQRAGTTFDPKSDSVGIERRIREALRKETLRPFGVFADLNLPSLFWIQENHRLQDEIGSATGNIRNDPETNDKSALIVLTNHPHYYGEPSDPMTPMHCFFEQGQTPEMAVGHESAIADIIRATLCYSQMPNAFQ